MAVIRKLTFTFNSCLPVANLRFVQGLARLTNHRRSLECHWCTKQRVSVLDVGKVFSERWLCVHSNERVYVFFYGI